MKERIGVLISGDRAVRVRMRGLIAHLDTPIESGGNTRVVYLRFANAEDMVNILQGVSQGQAKVGTSSSTDENGGLTRATQVVQQPVNTGNAPNVPAQVINQADNSVRARSATDSGESNVDIQADPNTNSLIITAPPDEMQNIQAVIRQLDIRRAQVLVEAVIAEITEDNTREFGINFLLDGSNKGIPAGFSNLGDATSGALSIAAGISTNTPPASLGSGLSLALGKLGSGEIDFGFLVRAIASNADNNILSTPSLMTLDNEEAEIVVGQNVPFVTGTQLSANNNNPFQTIERQDIGLTLKVKPQINDGNSIKMELEQEVSGVNTTALTGASDITTNKRSIKTTVLVEDGQTIVLGGLIDDQIQDVEEKVPLLGDIPFIGGLFRYRSTQKSKKNLMIFLHPRIMRDSESATQFSNSKYNFLRSQQTLYRQKKNNNILKEDDLLPELRLFFKGQPIDSPLTRFDDSPKISTDPVATVKDIDNLAGIRANNTTAIAGNNAQADNKAPEVFLSASMPSPMPSSMTTEFKETPLTENRPATSLIGRVDSHIDKTTTQSPTVSSITPSPIVDDSEFSAARTDQGTIGSDIDAAKPSLAVEDSVVTETNVASHSFEATNTVKAIELAAVAIDALDENLASDEDGTIGITTIASASPPSQERLLANATADGSIISLPAGSSATPKLPSIDSLTTVGTVPVHDHSVFDKPVGMANFWQLGINYLAPPPPQDVSKPEVEIVSIVVVDGMDQISDDHALRNFDSVQLTPSVGPLPGALQANAGASKSQN